MTLKKGAIGAPVAELQQLLTRAGYKVADDGWFGGATEQATSTRGEPAATPNADSSPF